MSAYSELIAPVLAFPDPPPPTRRGRARHRNRNRNRNRNPKGGCTRRPIPSTRADSRHVVVEIAAELSAEGVGVRGGGRDEVQYYVGLRQAAAGRRCPSDGRRCPIATRWRPVARCRRS